VDGVVVFCKGFLEAVGPNAIQLAEALADEAVEIRVGSFLRATLNNHVAQLDLDSVS
jgi:hypothetical protein